MKDHRKKKKKYCNARSTYSNYPENCVFRSISIQKINQKPKTRNQNEIAWPTRMVGVRPVDAAFLGLAIACKKNAIIEHVDGVFVNFRKITHFSIALQKNNKLSFLI